MEIKNLQDEFGDKMRSKYYRLCIYVFCINSRRYLIRGMSAVNEQLVAEEPLSGLITYQRSCVYFGAHRNTRLT